MKSAPARQPAHPTQSLQAVLPLVLFAGSALANPVVINLGILPNGVSSTANAISADGNTVTGQSGAVINSVAVDRAFRWVGPSGPMQMIPAPAANAFARGRCVNANGTAIGGDSDGIPFRWTLSGGTVFFPLLPQGSYGWILGMSANGNETCGIANGNNFTLTRAIHWNSVGSATQLLPFGNFNANNTSYAGGMDGSGTIIVGLSLESNIFRAVKWVNNGPAQNLGFISSQLNSQANAISSDGAVITGFAAAADGSSHVFRHTSNAGMVDLGKLFPNSFGARGLAISANGGCIVGEDTDSNGTDRAIIWTAATGIKDLAVYINNNGGSTAGWTFEFASGISADGSAICGTGFFNGDYRAFLVRGLPCIPTAPVINPNNPTTLCIPAGGTTTNGAATFSVDASGSDPITYAWSVELTEPGAAVGYVLPLTGPAFADPVSGLTFEVAGWDTPSITISSLRPGPVPRDIKFGGGVLNPCGGFNSPWFPLAIAACPAPCNPADVATSGSSDLLAGPDGFVTGEDFDVYVIAYFKELRNPNDQLIADLTDGLGTGAPDGQITGTDFDFFVINYFVGC